MMNCHTKNTPYSTPSSCINKREENGDRPVGDYFFDGILGISRPDYSGDRVVRISPAYLDSLESACGTRRIYNSEITVDWKRSKDGKITLKVKIGANLEARVHFGGEDHICLYGEYIFAE